jgi:hypothetical protein
MKRIFDLIISLCLVPVLLFPILVIALLVRLTSRGPALYWSDRVGGRQRDFQDAEIQDDADRYTCRCDASFKRPRPFVSACVCGKD